MKRDDEPGVLDLMEEAAHLLRRAPASAWATYVAATVPFVLGLLYFWADMAHSPLAADHVEAAALGLALLYVVMRTGQARFCARLRTLVTGEDEAPASAGLRHLLKLALAQAVLAPLGLLALLVSALVVIPAGWVYAFHQHLITGADAGHTDLRDQARRALADARPWVRQNHAFIGLALVLRGAVYLNIVILLALLPMLAKMFTGAESDFTRSYGWILSTTFQAVCVALTYLATDPLVKAFYTLRTYYIGARATGADLRASLGLRALAVLVIGLALAPAIRAESAPAVGSAAVTPEQLNLAIDQVQQRPEFLWRMPREFLPRKPEQDKNFLERFFEGLGKSLKNMWRDFQASLQRFSDWWERQQRRWHHDDPAKKAREPVSVDWASALQALSWLVLGLLAAALGVLVYRTWKMRPPRAAAAAAVPQNVVPDLEDEGVLATQLPEEEWLGLAETLLREGDARKALRALFLATLALLARAELVAVKRWKSNREYAIELERQGRRRPEAPPLFGANTLLFERSWYGEHPATADAVREARENWGRLKAHVEA